MVLKRQKQPDFITAAILLHQYPSQETVAVLMSILSYNPCQWNWGLCFHPVLGNQVMVVVWGLGPWKGWERATYLQLWREPAGMVAGRKGLSRVRGTSMPKADGNTIQWMWVRGQWNPAGAMVSLHTIFKLWQSDLFETQIWVCQSNIPTPR